MRSGELRIFEKGACGARESTLRHFTASPAALASVRMQRTDPLSGVQILNICGSVLKGSWILWSKDKTFGRKYKVNYLKHKYLLKKIKYIEFMRKNKIFLLVLSKHFSKDTHHISILKLSLLRIFWNKFLDK